MDGKPKKQAADKDERYRAPASGQGTGHTGIAAEQPGGLTRAEIVKAMGKGPSEVYRMLERLVARDYVSRSREGDRYALTMKLFVLGHRHPPVRRLVARALPLMDAFALAVRQSCHLVVPDRDAAIVVAQASSPGNWEFGIRIGAQIDLLATSSGQTLLAFQDEGARAEMLANWDRNGGRGDLCQTRARPRRISQDRLPHWRQPADPGRRGHQRACPVRLAATRLLFLPVPTYSGWTTPQPTSTRRSQP